MSSITIYNKAIIRLINILAPLLLSIRDQQVLYWKQTKGDQALRLNYSLSDKSIIFDLGGYEGQWASDIFSKYLSLIYVFEPVPSYAKNIKERFMKNNKIRVNNFGLSDANKVINLYLAEDGTSEFIKSGQIIKGKLRDFMAFVKKERIKSIDLMKINIEGGEYDLLEYIISSRFVSNIKNIQIQFHNCVPNAKNRMKNIQLKLAKTHKPTYQYEFLWENWQLKTE